jgi:hypothetical protein
MKSLFDCCGPLGEMLRAISIDQLKILSVANNAPERGVLVL